MIRIHAVYISEAVNIKNEVHSIFKFFFFKQLPAQLIFGEREKRKRKKRDLNQSHGTQHDDLKLYKSLR